MRWQNRKVILVNEVFILGEQNEWRTKNVLMSEYMELHEPMGRVQGSLAVFCVKLEVNEDTLLK